MKDKVTAADDVAFLRRRIIASDVPRDVADAVARTLDHITRCEQALDLVESGVTSALRHAPERAIINARAEAKR